MTNSKMFRQACLRINHKRRFHFRCEPLPFSPEPLKRNLIKNLKEVRGCNSAEELCRIFLNVKSKYEDPNFGSTSPCDYFEKGTDAFINQLGNILSKEKPDYTLSDMIIKELSPNDFDRSGFSSKQIDKRNMIVSLLLEMKKFKTGTCSYDNSREYFKKILNDIESLIGSFEERSRYENYCQKYPPGGFDLLQFVLRKSKVEHAEDLLDTIYDIGRAHLDFSEDEKREIGSLMVDIIIPMSRCVMPTGSINRRLESSWLRKRSALQFYKEFYSKFPAESGTLLESFHVDEIDKSIPVLDKLIIDWCSGASWRITLNLDGHENFCNAYDSETDLDETDLEENDPSTMPKSHTWWTRCVLLLKELKKTAPKKSKRGTKETVIINGYKLKTRERRKLHSVD